RPGGLRREAPEGSEAPAGTAPVLQALELLRGPPGAPGRRAGGPDRLGLRLPDPGAAAQGSPACKDGASERVAGRGEVRPPDPKPRATRRLPPRPEVGTPPAEEGNEGGEPRVARRAP